MGVLGNVRTKTAGDIVISTIVVFMRRIYGHHLSSVPNDPDTDDPSCQRMTVSVLPAVGGCVTRYR